MLRLRRFPPGRCAVRPWRVRAAGRGMPDYVLEWTSRSGGRPQTWRPPPFANDAAAIRAACRFFQSRKTDQNEELWIYEISVNGWGMPRGRLVGMIALNLVG